MTNKAQYTAERNRCNFHPESCCCNPWRVMKPDGTRHSTYYDRDDADLIADALNEK